MICDVDGLFLDMASLGDFNLPDDLSPFSFRGIHKFRRRSMVKGDY